MKVKVVSGNRGRFVLRWQDHEGKTRQRTLDLKARPSNRDKAYQYAVELEMELSGQTEPKWLIPKRQRKPIESTVPTSQSALTGEWEAYKKYLIETHLEGLSASYKGTMLPILNRFEKFSHVVKVQDVRPQIIRKWLASLRDEGLAPASVKTYWRHLAAFLSIACEDGVIKSVPKIRLPKAPQKKKGRPLVGEELDRIKKAVEELRPESEWETWKWSIDALWFSGLRISEAYRITWNPSDFYVDMEGKHPSYMILGDQKNAKHERLPIVPDFADMLRKVPKIRRRGNVFKFPGRTNSGQLSFYQAKNVISALGGEAKIKTENNKTATPHDFRRSFGSRWALKVMPQILQKLMRHANISTTMKYYAHLDADAIIEFMNNAHTSKTSHHRRSDGKSKEPS